MTVGMAAALSSLATFTWKGTRRCNLENL